MRRRAAVKRKVIPDAKYHNILLTKFMNVLMLDGKKSVAEGIVYGALEIVEKKTKQDAIEGFLEALKKVRPSVEVRSRRVGGATYQVPMEVRYDRSVALGLRWLIIAARKRSEKTMRERLAGEILDALQDRGAAVKKREDTHKMADANKAFSHFKW
ncbi:MAG: 30S ribosomal protein S7 [Alphaproteobacteria bacterium CG11_big_fil_rev_8_21_14_0_20_44_7]|nr:MAG: 30S ribosomal protein S7 [Alphaproteobacteria bacterium CG11_big_fil_rev_8_21_14_0_20_44_7]